MLRAHGTAMSLSHRTLIHPDFGRGGRCHGEIFGLAMISVLQQRSAPFAQALDPSSIPMDGRDSRDRLAFVAAYARLIQYYNSANQVAGNWQRFFMKDPLILLAHISKTDYAIYHARFALIEQGLDKAKERAHDALITQLCHLLQELLSTINQWLRFMELHTGTHYLHKFLEKKIRELLASRLALLVALQHALHRITGQVAAPDTLLYRSFEPIWFERSFNFSTLITADVGSIEPLVAALRRIYHAVFGVFAQAIEYATQAFYQSEQQPTVFADTALMIVFSRLMEAQKSQINKLGAQHLGFYYDRVLQQSQGPAQADQVYVNLRLSETVAAFHLPAGTPFLAGSYPDQSDILFASEAALDITQAVISSAYTLYNQPSTRADCAYLTRISSPTQITRNLSQEILSWDGFGNAQGQPVQQGLALASPMLLLQSGLRTITITLSLVDAKETAAFSLTQAQCSLSTASAWWPVMLDPSSSANCLVIILQPSDPPIVAFKANPDGYTSHWPLLKIMLPAGADLQAVPSLTQVDIQVDVNDFSALSMANDFSILPPGAAQAILGPVPQVGSHFYVGSNECFAKPLQSLTLNLTWDQLPSDFKTYYAAYNQYLVSAAPTSSPSSTTLADTFNNLAFRGIWMRLQQNSWESQATIIPERLPPPPHTPPPPPQLCPDSIFTFTFEDVAGGVAQPALALAALPPVNQASDGYLCFELTQPTYAFGNSLYPKVVAQVSLKNAQWLMQQAKVVSLGALLAGIVTSIRNWIAKIIGGLVAPFAKLAHVAKTALQSVGSLWLKAKRLISAPTPPPTLATPTPVLASSPSAPAPAMAQVPAPQEATKAAVALFQQYEQSPPPPSPAAPLTAPPTGLQESPNLPYVPKQASLTGSYQAQASMVIAAPGPTQTQGPTPTPATSPLELFHYGSFKPYLAYDSTSDSTSAQSATGFLNLTPQDIDPNNPTPAQLALFTGVGGPGCLYLSLANLQAPCSFTLYAQISVDDSQALPSDGDVGYYFWGTGGWQPLTVLMDDTGSFSRSGVIKFEVPALITTAASAASSPPSLSYLTSPLMPSADFWLAIAIKNAVKKTGINIQLSYLDTQSLKLIRTSLAALPAGQVPQLEANVIAAPKNKIAQIAFITQPFPSFGGAAAQTKSDYAAINSFYRQVSVRLGNKDRVISSADYAEMAHQANSELYAARVLPGSRGQVRVGLVKRYANAQLPDAFRPHLNSLELGAVAAALSSKVAAPVDLQVVNLQQQVVTVQASLLIASDADLGEMQASLNQSIKVYLSPWICSDQPQASLGPSINQSALIGFLSSCPGVLAVTQLQLIGAQTLQDEGMIYVSAMAHLLSFEFAEAAHG